MEKSEIKGFIAKRCAKELKDGDVVNLGIGLPSMVANFVPPNSGVYFQAENGVIGLGARPLEGMEDPHLTDAGGGFVHEWLRPDEQRFVNVGYALQWWAFATTTCALWLVLSFRRKPMQARKG